MDLLFGAEDETFRQEVKDFIAEAYDDEMRDAVSKSHNNYLPKHLQIRWQQRLNDKGWAATNWPEEYGGTKLTHTQKYIWDQEMARESAPGIVPFGLKMVAPVIMKFGTPEQKERFLPDILATNVWWCQGYSEPGAGSDLASLQCKAEDKGDHYLVNGQKIWTSAAQHADWIFCLVRTSKEEKRQQGISFLLIDMHNPGISVEPIITIDMPSVGNQEVNSVFFQDVKVPKENLIGNEGEGWTCAKYLLEFERGNAYSAGLYQSLKKVRKIASNEGQDGQKLIDDPAFATKVADAESQINALEMTELRILSQLSTGQNMGPESSLMKCRGTELQQLISELALEAAGMSAVPFQPVAWGRNEEPVGPDYSGAVAPRYFNYRKVAIYAGSNEIQRNIMAKLILGL
jgi:alkylation response protein AidB-like acyl-CoA dehydrogenase